MLGCGGDAASNCEQELRIAVCDFRGSVQDNQPKHLDFEQAVTDDRAIVAPMLGADSKPVYAPGPSGTTPTTGQSNFDQWYRDVDGVNIHIDVTIPLTPDPTRAGVFVYDNTSSSRSTRWAGRTRTRTTTTTSPDVFYADRHCCDSTFHIETTLQCIRNIIVP